MATPRSRTPARSTPDAPGGRGAPATGLAPAATAKVPARTARVKAKVPAEPRTGTGAPTKAQPAKTKAARAAQAAPREAEPSPNGRAGAVQHYRPDVGLLTWTLKLAEREAAKELDRTLHHTGLTKSQFGVMQALTHLEKASSAALARTVFVTPQAMVGIVAGLERKGFIRRKASAASARVIEATVTPAGRAAYEHAAAAIDGVDAAIAGAFTPAELEQVSDYLQRLIDVLQRHGAPAG